MRISLLLCHVMALCIRFKTVTVSMVHRAHAFPRECNTQAVFFQNMHRVMLHIMYFLVMVTSVSVKTVGVSRVHRAICLQQQREQGVLAGEAPQWWGHTDRVKPLHPALLHSQDLVLLLVPR